MTDLIALAPSILSADFARLGEEIAEAEAGGADLIAGTVPKIRRIRPLLDRLQPGCELEVDGGIHAETAALAVEAGARVLVAGSAIFEDPAGVRAGMARLRASVPGAG